MMRLSTVLYPALGTMHMAMGHSQRGTLLRDED